MLMFSNFVILVKDSGETGALNTITFLTGIPMFIVIVALMLLVYRMRGTSSSQADMRVKYKNEHNDENAENFNSFANPLSI